MKFPWKVTRLGLLGVLGMAFGTVNPCKAQNYTITDLGTLPGHIWSTASGINARGQIVGSSSPDSGCGLDSCHPFLWQDGVMTDLLTIPFSGGEANAINASGQTAGTLRVPGGALAASYNINSCVIPFAIGNAFGINDSGQVPGGMNFGNFGGFFGFLFSNGVLSRLNPLRGYDGSQAYGINATGEVVGRSFVCDEDCFNRATLWSEGLIRDLGINTDIATAINDAGQVVGRDLVSGTPFGHAWLWREGGGRTDLGTLPGDFGSSALAINNAGQIVGSSNRGFAFIRAVRWSDGVIVNLNDLIPADSGWVLREATGINDRGQIVGQGLIGGQLHAFLLTP